MDRETFGQGVETYQFLAPPGGGDEIGRLAHFRVIRLLGRGGMGMVFAAEDMQLQRRVALKVMRPEIAAIPQAAARFLREARATAAIKHPNVITIYEAGEDRGIPFLAMELLSGTSLQEWIKQFELAGVGQIVAIGRGIASGLSAIHGHGLVHRDIKPSNVWLEAPDGRVRILDFGLARGAESDSELTQLGSILGTLHYMSPEQASGQPVDHRSDLFSLGCILYRLATGRVPFQGNSTVEVLKAVAIEPAPPVSQFNSTVPATLCKLIGRLLAKDPKDRPQSARAVSKALEPLARDRQQSGRKIAISQTAVANGATPAVGSTVAFDSAAATDRVTGPITSRRWRRTALIAVLVLAAIGILGITLRRNAATHRWVYADLDDDPGSWKVFVEGTPKWECSAVAATPGGGNVLRCSITGGEPYSNAHFYRHLPGTGSDAPKRFTLAASFRFSPTTHNNRDGKSTIQALEFTVSEWRSGRRHELALQWLNVGPNAPCWRCWDPNQTIDRWRDLALPAALVPNQWHVLELEGWTRDNKTHYRRFTVDGQTHELGIVVVAADALDELERVAVGVQLDGNAQENPYEVHLNNVSCTIEAQ